METKNDSPSTDGAENNTGETPDAPNPTTAPVGEGTPSEGAAPTETTTPPEGDGAPVYSLVLNFNDEVQELEGDTILEMIQKLPLPDSAGTAASFTFKKGETELTVVLPANKVLAFFRLETRQELLSDMWQRQVDEAEAEEIEKAKAREEAEKNSK